ncbi:hypothetical protein DL89DRAFT_321402 [Linderina pennispora]|uniref:Uncharacterized protein n=1 Tax=Linderina pennispora TaxID=61395 RepID=A0A1Y1WFU2_9FUNG|nr:uncharacterized protein DL89DRAFT_321402 [Linderina pennispora]ORX72352.1 hypothetical protein DL89DRAFT_321402 [Linderina pennispora]
MAGCIGESADSVATAAGMEGQMSPKSCTVLIVDRRFLKGVYHTTTNEGSPRLRTGPARDDVVFVQELLEIYSQVVAVLSGDTALRWIFNNTGQRTIIVLIDVDDTFDRSSRQGPIYTPPASPEDGKQCGSDAEGPYGLALLRVIAHYAAIGVFRNVAPIEAANLLRALDTPKARSMRLFYAPQHPHFRAGKSALQKLSEQ